jgi:Zn-finger nucleic acid-binding protein
MKKKLNVTLFVEDYSRGLSEEGLERKHELNDGQLRRAVELMQRDGYILPETTAERYENLKIRYGTAEPICNGKPAVDLNSGLVLHCPSCGAAVKRDAFQCEYCHAALDFSHQGKTITCPHCFGETPADAKFCIKCAHQVAGLVKKGLVIEDRLCPRCSVPMRGTQVGEFSLFGCEECSGTFVPHEVFEMMQEKRDGVVFTVDPLKKAQHSNEEYVKYVRCPICRTIMNRRNFADISGVIIDTCKGHGVWFDAGELDKVMEFIARGGLEKARELAREKALNDEKLARIKSEPIPDQTAAYQDGLLGNARYDSAHDIVRLIKWVMGD